MRKTAAQTAGCYYIDLLAAVTSHATKSCKGRDACSRWFYFQVIFKSSFLNRVGQSHLPPTVAKKRRRSQMRFCPESEKREKRSMGREREKEREAAGRQPTHCYL